MKIIKVGHVYASSESMQLEEDFQLAMINTIVATLKIAEAMSRTIFNVFIMISPS